MSEPQSMVDEFATEASWTAEAVAELGAEHALPAACRGSGSPAALTWLGDRLGLGVGTRLLDSGAGLGGPAEYVARSFGARPVLVEPMEAACRAAGRFFDHPVAAADGGALPFATGAFRAAWSLGVLCTVEDQAGLLAELARVVVPGGAIGLLAFVRTVDVLPEQPDGNLFPTSDDLEGLLRGARLEVHDRALLSDFPDAGPAWERALHRVDTVLERDHGSDERWLSSRRQQAVLGKLLDEGLVVGHLVAARHGSRPSGSSGP